MEYLDFLYFRLTNIFYLTYRALNVLSEECDLIQSELYRNFLICFLAPFIYRLLEKKLERKYTCEELLSTLVE